MNPKKDKMQFLSIKYIEDLNRLCDLLKECCKAFGINEDDVCSNCRKQNYVFARYMFCHIAQHSSFHRQLNGIPKQELISQFIGRKNVSASYFKTHVQEVYLYSKHFREVIDQGPYKTYFQTIKK